MQLTKRTIGIKPFCKRERQNNQWLYYKLNFIIHWENKKLNQQWETSDQQKC